MERKEEQGTYLFQIESRQNDRLVQVCGHSIDTIHVFLTACVAYLFSVYTQRTQIKIETTKLSEENRLPSEGENRMIVISVKQEEMVREYLNKVKENFFQKQDCREDENYFEDRGVLVLCNKECNEQNDIRLARNYIAYCFEVKQNTIIGHVYFNTYMWDSYQVRVQINLFHQIMESFLTKPDEVLCELPLLELEESLENQGYHTEEYPKDKTLSEVFGEMVKRYPERIAVFQKNRSLTYWEFDELSEEISNLLKMKGLKKQVPVGILLDRSLELTAAVIGVLKAGCICIPLDTRYPQKRVETILKDSKAAALITQEDESSIGIEGISILLRDTTEHSEEAPEYINASGKVNTAFYIYTSGSEGKPKGVALSHQGIINHVYSKIRDIEMNQDDIMCYSLSPGFVASIWQLFAPLYVGASLYICTEDEMIAPYTLFTAVEQNFISVLEIVPSVLESYLRQLEHGAEPRKLENMKMLVLTGEEVKSGLVRKFYQQYHIPLMNAYGQSECSDDTLHYKIPYEFSGQKIPIGKPVGNTKVYILGVKGKIVPNGALGEICIGGDGLALGYVGDQKLSEQKFVQNPYQPRERLYHTGDFGRWMEEGVIEFLGRRDRQVKLRGFRIETGEIEERLMECKQVREAVVLKKNLNGRELLCAYVVMEDRKVTMEALMKKLKSELPWYMVPSNLIEVEQIPKTMNGKVDSKCLPEPGQVSYPKNRKTEGETEQVIAQIWKEVLNTSGADVADNFFDVGGNSLTAAEMVMSIEKRLGISISIADIFSAPTIRSLSQSLIDSQKQKQRLMKQEVQKTEYALSPAQKRLYILNAYGDKDGKSLDAYNVEYEVEIKGTLDVERLRKAFLDLVRRHDILRTTFHLQDGALIQKVHDEAEIDFEYQDLSLCKNHGSLKSGRCLFDLEHGPLICIRIYKVKVDEYIFHLRMSHMITDGYSIYILMSELEALYQGRKLKEPRLQYQDYISWQESFFQGKEFQKQEKYWKEQYKDSVPKLELPLDYKREQKQNFGGRTIFFEVGKKRVEAIRKMEKENDVSCFMVLYSIFLILLEKYTGSYDIVIGTVSSGRYNDGWYELPGMFVNTLPIRTKIEGKDTCQQVFAKVKDSILQALDNQAYPFELLTEKLEKYHDMRRNPVYDTMFIMQNEMLEIKEFAGLQVSPCSTRIEGAKCDLTMNAYVSEDTIHMGLNYCTKIFREKTVKKFTESYLKIMDAITDTTVQVDDIDVVSDIEKDQLYTFGSKSAEYPKDKLLTEVFEQVAQKYPNKTAVLDLHGRVTYQDLNEQSDHIASELKRKFLDERFSVGILLERSVEFVEAVLGVLKAGGICIPLDIRYPETRVMDILEECKAQAVLTKMGAFQDTWGTITKIKEDKLIMSCKHRISGSDEKKSNLKMSESTLITANETAFYIYTSGSEGRPKAVALSHRGILNHAYAKISDIGMGEQDKMCYSLSLGFVASIWQLFAPLYVGGSLYICTRKEMEDPYALFLAVEHEQVSVLEVVPSVLECYLKQLEQGALQRDLKKLKILVLTGEEVRVGLVKRFYRRYHIPLMNAYGQSECSDNTLHYRIPFEFAGDKVPIGKPVANTQVYIVGKEGKLVPVGVKGEICIGGDGLALGYVNNQTLAKQKFIENPFRAGQRLYRTGDLGRWTQQGVIEFLGRCDQQVKLRGFRCELGEVEEKLLELSEVLEAAVVKKVKNGRDYLCAYVVLEDSECQIETIKRWLGRELPWYMVPSNVMAVREIPKTMNGKTDIKRLPEPKQVQLMKSVQPTGKTEEVLERIWKEVLNTDEAGVTDNFFELGGNSLVAAELTMKIQKELKKNVPIREIMKGMSIKEAKDYLERQKS